MNTNKTTSKVIYPKLSYEITGILFETHNELGPYCREKQYADVIESKLKKKGIAYRRECTIGETNNIVDFIIEDTILLELKTDRFLTKAHYFQTQRYLQETRLNLGLLVNFRNKYLKPNRIVRIDTNNKAKYISSH